MKHLLLIAAVLLVSQFANAHSDPAMSKAKVAELSAHRIDRLVALGKIDAAFLKRVEKIEVMEVSGPAPVAYMSMSTQTQPTSGQAIQLDLQFDHDGKPLSYKVSAGGVAGPDSGWSPKNAGELIENGMHYVLENATNATVAPYFKDFSSLTLVKAVLAGRNVALLQVRSSAVSKKLKIYLNLDGTLISTAIEP